MTGPRDIERTLDAWFVDGPTVMPDRLFDAVLDQVGRTRQQPLARLRLRLTEMTPRIRLYTLLAAAVLVVLAAVAVIGGGSQRAVRSTDAPSDVPSDNPSPAAAVDMPAGLVATWMGGHRPIDGVDPDAGVTLEIGTTASVYLTESASATTHLLRSQVASIDGDRFQLVTSDDVRACAAGDAGEYGWSLSSSGRLLEITLVSDDCTARADGVPGTYWLMDCPTEDDNCLGPLDAGTYSSQFIDPYVVPGASWTPRFGALTYTVPDGWVNVEDWPTYFALAPENAPGETALYVWSDIVAAGDPCAQTKATGVGESARELATWVAGLSGVDASAPEQVTIGGLDAWQLDVSLNRSYSKTCDEAGGFVAKGLFTDHATAEGFGWVLTPDAHLRVHFADLGDGRALAVVIQSDQPSAYYDTFLAEATTIVESFAISPG